jgi:hypothetical protein
MGLAGIRGKLYVALFNGVGKGPTVVTMPLSGGRYSPALVGFAAPVVALGAHGGRLYAGDLTGTIYSVTPCRERPVVPSLGHRDPRQLHPRQARPVSVCGWGTDESLRCSPISERPPPPPDSSAQGRKNAAVVTGSEQQQSRERSRMEHSWSRAVATSSCGVGNDYQHMVGDRLARPAARRR